MSKPKRPRLAKLALGDERRLTAGGAHHRAPAWSRDGRLLAFAVGQVDDAAWVVVDRRGRVVRVLEGPAAGTATFSRDGSLAFERRFGASSEIWLTPGGDAPAVRLLGSDGRLWRDPVFSPDGKTLACAAAEDADGRTRLHLVSLDTGRAIALTATPERSDARPSFTPDGEQLIFEAAHGEDHALYALHLIHNTLERLTPVGERARRPAALDQRLVIYERSTDNGHTELVVLDRELQQTLVLSDGDARRGDPALCHGKNGKVRLAYAAQTAAPGEPPRYDIFTTRLRGVGKAREAVEPDAARPEPVPVEAAR